MFRFSDPASGDKTATGHGQKGVIKIWREEDMPFGIDDRNNTIKFDMVVAVSSINNRLTVSQYYEIVSGATAAREGRRLVIEPCETQCMHMETVLYHGKTRELMIQRTAMMRHLY